MFACADPSTFQQLNLITAGKTKWLYEDPQMAGGVIVHSIDHITAGDGAKRDVLLGKGVLATTTTCNTFRLLKECNLPVAFTGRIAADAFTAPRCQMLSYEVVARRKALGSSLKRAPHLKKGPLIHQLVIEFFLKTTGRRWNEHTLPCDDPFMIPTNNGTILLYDPAVPLNEDDPFLVLSGSEVHRTINEESLYPIMANITRKAFLALESAWRLQGGELVDFKIEFGISPNGELLIADVIDSDSWRVLIDNVHVDKQSYRDGEPLDKVLAKYVLGAELTSRFALPRQQIIIWRGSPNDDSSIVTKAIKSVVGDNVTLTDIVCSMHKEPARGLSALAQAVQKIPDSVVIALIGRSNGAGPTLSAATNVPVITVPVGYKEFPDDVWSSLRTPSDTPVMTVLEPGNAALAALNILSARSPAVYMAIREQLERRLTNFIPI